MRTRVNPNPSPALSLYQTLTLTLLVFEGGSLFFILARRLELILSKSDEKKKTKRYSLLSLFEKGQNKKRTFPKIRQCFDPSKRSN